VNTRSLITALALLTAALSFAIYRSMPADRPVRNVLFIVVDTLRADALGAYGNPLALSPNLDAFAKEAIVFEQTWAQGAYTMASYLSYMSSTHVRSHGLDGNLGKGGICAWNDITLLPEVLTPSGFRTTAFVSNSNLHPKNGFPRGFDTWNGLTPEQLGANTLTRKDYDIGDVQVVRRGVAAMQGWSAQERNFLYLHTLGPHLPLTPSKTARARVGLPTDSSWRPVHLQEIRRLRQNHTAADEERTRLAYLADVFDADRDVGRLLQGLEDSGHAESTAVFIFSDHGEEIWEHGDYGHQDGVWEQLIHVPLMVRVPGLTPKRVPSLVGLIDLVPTLLPLLGVEASQAWQGRDLFAPYERDVMVSQRFEERAISRGDGLKAIWRKAPTNPNWRFFQLENDPTEQSPLTATQAPKNTLEHQAASWSDKTPRASRPRHNEAIGICGRLSAEEEDEHNEALRALGYVE
jgi:arylsulfatase A-like enzyme